MSVPNWVGPALYGATLLSIATGNFQWIWPLSRNGFDLWGICAGFADRARSASALKMARHCTAFGLLYKNATNQA